MSINSPILNASLTEAQQEAVEHFEGPLLVLAGPGSGKTRVITHRIVRLLQRGVQPDQILALTFTNKAAREMAARVERLLGGLRVRVSTFHRFCSRLLRRWPEHVGLKDNFTILDQSDQVTLVRNIMKEEKLDGVFHEPGRVLSRISRARNDMITAEVFRRFEVLRLYALPFADNPASIRVLEKAGYVLEGHLRRSAIKDGRVRDQLLYATYRA